MRDKLIEILRKPIFPHELADPTEAVADYLLDNGVTVQKWIPVTERLPENPLERVLALCIGDYPVGNPKIDTDRYKDGRWVRYGKDVTHWMPLPSTEGLE